MQETVQEKAPERPAQTGQLKASAGAAAAPPFVDNRPSTAAQLKLAQLVHSAPKAVAQRRQMGVITGATAQLEDDDEPLQAKAQLATPPQDAAVAAAADKAEQVGSSPMQLQAEPVRQYAFRRTWGDEEPEKAPAAPQAEEQAAPEAAAPQAPAKKPGFFERMKNGVKNVAGKVGRALLNWSGQGKPPAGAAAATPQRPGAQPAPVQAPAGPKVYVPNEKRVSARRVPSRAPITGRAAAADKTRADMTSGMLGNASLDAVSAETKAANAPNAPAAAANPAAMVEGVIESRMRSSAPGLMRQGLASKMGPLAAAEQGAVASKLTAVNYAVAGQSYKGEEFAGAAAKAASAAAKQNGA